MSQADAFDPFGILETVTEDVKSAFSSGTFVEFPAVEEEEEEDAVEPPRSPPPVSRVSRSTPTPTTATIAGTSATIAGTSVTTASTHTIGKGLALPPKMSVKLSIAEEVSSTTVTTTEEGGSTIPEGASQVIVDGSIHAQVQCSDAMKNAPFCCGPVGTTDEIGTVVLHPHPDFLGIDDLTGEQVVKIPKHEIGMVPILKYTYNHQIQHMPLLLERKVTLSGGMCRIAVQVRSKLTNHGNLHNFTIAVAVPECVNGATMEIVRGEGDYDELKRTILWKLEELPRGESFMVSAQAKLWDANTTEIQFPVLLRCSSFTDQISDVEFKVTAAAGYPSSITFTTTHSFRLLHRLS